MADEAPDRKTRIERRIEKLIHEFDHYLTWYDKHTPFKKPDQLKSHVMTIRRRTELGSAIIAATDSVFCNNLYRTLQYWGIGQRASVLIPYEAFAEVLASRASEIARLDGITIDDPALDVQQIADQVWQLIDSLGIVVNISKLVPSTKALHHLLPDLIVPVDREYTQTFFGLHNPEFQGQYGSQRPVFTNTFATFARIARAAEVNSYVGMGQSWRTSRSKVIDNALVGFCVAEGLSKPS
jgi:hypothetical protein